MPKVSAEDRLFKARIANVLRSLREAAGRIEGKDEWTQEKAAEKIGVPTGTLGRWERGDHAPKGYDLGRLYRAYERFGARWEWFFDPPEVVVTNPIRDYLVGQAVTSGAEEGLRRAAESPAPPIQRTPRPSPPRRARAGGAGRA